MLKSYFNHVFKAVMTRLLFIVISFFLLLTFAWTISPEKGFFYYSLIAALAYLPTVYNDAWHAAKRDKKSGGRAFFLNGFLTGAAAESVGALLLAGYWAAGRLGASGEAFKMIYIIWVLPFWGFIEGGGLFQKTEAATGHFWALLLIMPATSFLGYLAGKFEIAVLNKLLPKLIYKDAKQK